MTVALEHAGRGPKNGTASAAQTDLVISTSSLLDVSEWAAAPEQCQLDGAR